MTPSDLSPQHRVLRAAISANVPVFLIGDPGIGKTSLLGAYAQATGRHLEVVTGTTSERADIAGYPIHDERTSSMEYSPLGWAKRLAQAKKGLLLLGEFNLSEPDIQRAFMRVLQEKMVGTQRLPETVSIVMDGNFTTGSAGAFDLLPPVANRILHLPWELDRQAWLDGVMSDFAASYEPFDDTAPAADEHVAHEKSLILGFLDAHKFLIHKMPEQALGRSGAWPSPRSWSNAMAVMPRLDDDDPDAQHLALSGLVGGKAADTYMSWRQAMSRFSIQDLIQHPESHDWRGESGSQLFVVMSTIAEWGISRGSQKAFAAALESITTIAEASGKKDVALRGIQRLLDEAPQGATIPRRTRATFDSLLRASGAWETKESTNA